MNEAARKFDTQEIVVEECFRTRRRPSGNLTTGELVGRWLGMTPTGFEPVKGTRFTFQTTPAARGRRDPLRVLEVIRDQRFSFSWQAAMRAIRNTARASTRQSLCRSPRSTAAQNFVCCIPLRDAEERYRVPQHERRLEEGLAGSAPCPAKRPASRPQPSLSLT